jgi:hypothetical protein
MKTSSAANPVNRSLAVRCLLVNQFATPGLGSLMGRRFLAGSAQLTLALAGFAGVIGWFVQIIVAAWQQLAGNPAQPKPYPWMGTAGLILFVTAWLLSWTTSVSLLREARRNAAIEPPKLGVPPKLG